MATRTEIEKHYDTVGALHELRMESVQGDYPDYTCALYDGDFSKTYSQAQKDKHAWIFNGLGLGQNLSGKRVLDIGCGWGPILNAVRERRGEAIGLTLSSWSASKAQPERSKATSSASPASPAPPRAIEARQAAAVQTSSA